MERFQSKEGALAALRDIERFLEGAPSMLSSGPEALLQEYEAVLTPQLQVISYQTHTEQRYIHVVLYGPSPRGHTQWLLK